jgi:hypothetical protein
MAAVAQQPRNLKVPIDGLCRLLLVLRLRLTTFVGEAFGQGRATQHTILYVV